MTHVVWVRQLFACALPAATASFLYSLCTPGYTEVPIVHHLLCTVAHPRMSATCPFLFHCESSGGLNAIEVVQEQANGQLGRAVNVPST